MIFYYDTEFIERGYDKIELISIGIHAENGAEYYAVASDGWDRQHASNWVKENVLPFVADVRSGRASRSRRTSVLSSAMNQNFGHIMPTTITCCSVSSLER
jgi:hypothetical protein